MTITDQVVRGPVKKDRPEPVVRTVTRRNAAGHDLGKVDLEPSIFGHEPNVAVMHQVVTAQLAAARSGTQSTKTRSEVRGGGAKPFSQKGTGRARQGSSRSPSMSGGGIALGPKPRSYRQHTPKKMVRLALLSALSDRAMTERIALIDAWGIEAPKTKDAALVLRKLKLAGTVLIVLAPDESVMQLSLANLPNVQTATFAELSAHDVLRFDWLLFSDRTLPGSTEVLAGGAQAGADAEPAPATPSAAEVAPKAAPKRAATKKAAPEASAAPKAAKKKAAATKATAKAAPKAAVTEPDVEPESESEEAGTDA
jgi:large subunit ribosomal protein L4